MGDDQSAQIVLQSNQADRLYEAAFWVSEAMHLSTKEHIPFDKTDNMG